MMSCRLFGRRALGARLRTPYRVHVLVQRSTGAGQNLIDRVGIRHARESGGREPSGELQNIVGLYKF
jgi:hypothetical protein